ncbi:hypothetical protein A2V71_02890 [Candidatus Berkelbacteria bacterium RBG_13_40_8]|uniref:Uncharacterized protein n=1 Tax=Candidatus Berkelbacteria bacterium RBG_13_40_8 TaxID=1797467 RepID=A0A1F5DMF5_9BACT|nr:MAG: hypothetical protein A2V71_02890 [Candidatus Berkelbacteria bacterium RBG_13_40_8]
MNPEQNPQLSEEDMQINAEKDKTSENVVEEETEKESFEQFGTRIVEDYVKVYEQEERAADAFHLSSNYKTIQYPEREGQLVEQVKQKKFEMSKIFEEFADCAEDIETRTEELTNERIARHIKFRHKYVSKLLLEDRYKYFNLGGMFVRDKLNGPLDEIPDSELAFGAKETHIIYAAFLLSPSNSTKEFIENLNSTASISMKGVKIDYGRKTVAKALMSYIQQGGIKSWEGKKVLEVGGDLASEGIQKMGASSEVTDAGHSGYTIGYRVDDKEKLMHLGNYQKFGQPHTYDLICSANLFDMGSGIGEIAKAYKPLDRDKLGEEEMTLIMGNLVKQNGFMLHDEGGLPPKLSSKAGIKNIFTLNLGGSKDHSPYENVTFYRANGRRVIKEHKMDYKSAIFNPKTKTWELKNDN